MVWSILESGTQSIKSADVNPVTYEWKAISQWTGIWKGNEVLLFAGMLMKPKLTRLEVTIPFSSFLVVYMIPYYQYSLSYQLMSTSGWQPLVTIMNGFFSFWSLFAFIRCCRDITVSSSMLSRHLDLGVPRFLSACHIYCCCVLSWDPA